jgi:hypothetical protein
VRFGTDERDPRRPMSVSSPTDIIDMKVGDLESPPIA